MTNSWEKCKIDAQTDNDDFIGHNVGGGSKNTYILKYIYKSACMNVKPKRGKSAIKRI